MDVRILPSLESNYIFVLIKDGRAAVVDPGVVEPVVEVLEAEGLGLDLILSTHHHGDHIAGNGALKERYGAKIVGPRAEARRISGMDHMVSEGDVVEFAGSQATVIETPGHTSGHIAFHFADEKMLFCGDTLFSLGCGRLFEGTAPQMWESLKKLRALPDETLVYCGHEYSATNAGFSLGIDPDNRALAKMADGIHKLRNADKPTIPSRLGDEKAANPFLRADDASLQAALGMEGRDAATVFGEIRSRRNNI